MLAAAAAAEPPASYSPTLGADHPRNVYWGDLHVHTSYSADANSFGNRHLTPEDAYRFGRGEAIRAANGMQARLERPLDFVAVTDHAESLGLMRKIDVGDPNLPEAPIFSLWREMRAQGKFYEVTMQWARYKAGPGRPPLTTPGFVNAVWKEYCAFADGNYQPGRFTTFIGYEWTSMPDGDNLHRNVIFADTAERATQVVPFSASDSEDPEDLWRFMERYTERTGGAVIDIPHNSNLSGGRMFELRDMKGRPFTTHYARTRARWEPLVEATQFKGDSESHPYLSPTDEFAAFGDWDWANLLGSKEHQPSWFAGEYVREALKNGLKVEATLGVNPFKFGLVGSTDSHTAMATAEEDNWWGKMADDGPAAERVQQVRNWGKAKFSATQFLSSGYTAVWATDNTREAIFAALQRRETYATTGPRMVVRFFGGWRFARGDERLPDLARVGYGKGVPMGGDITRSPQGKAPTFLVHVARDPEGANLDRVQIIKGWVDAGGVTHERVFDVAVAGGRTIDADGRAREAVGNTVDVGAATYANGIGAPELAAVWTDPAFDPAERAFYYLRAIEIPTPRWPAHDAKFFGFTLPPEVQAVEQDRAYSSPIWYTPST
ncbi:MAG: DUF3604 domain-containing protein [Gammaproteobacteria bacterium]